MIWLSEWASARRAAIEQLNGMFPARGDARDLVRTMDVRTAVIAFIVDQAVGTDIGQPVVAIDTSRQFDQGWTWDAIWMPCGGLGAKELLE
ncbi:hypothetical protein NC77_28550 [Janthinobacterium lividum]|nr:hypothetical protein NC77_28550 [Janthinobacterium lividum]